ncbi:hypothetical protein [Hugenholtzia roseola]|uniref:hypothetical protein n=1 Tax=Hugenholtzia roseola TaxID=1002 RepID=UPI0004153727|nr:hypothetical protein [Hugenholtzia roseola]
MKKFLLALSVSFCVGFASLAYSNPDDGLIQIDLGGNPCNNCFNGHFGKPNSNGLKPCKGSGNECMKR